MLFNLYEGSSVISALPVCLCCKTLSADMDWDSSRCFMVMFCRWWWSPVSTWDLMLDYGPCWTVNNCGGCFAYIQRWRPQKVRIWCKCTIPEIGLIFQHVPLSLMADWRPQNLPEKIKTFSSRDHQPESNSNYKWYLFCGLRMACVTRNHRILLKVAAFRENPWTVLVLQTDLPLRQVVWCAGTAALTGGLSS